MRVTKRESSIEAVQFTGENFEELKALAPHLEKYTFRDRLNQEQIIKEYPFKGYTVGWKNKDAVFGESMTEALPGFWIVKIDEEFKILEPHEFKKQYDKV